MIRHARAIVAHGWVPLIGQQQQRVQECQVPWLFVGVGNLGTKFHGTRHNIGFEMIDAVSKAEGIALSTIQYNAIIGQGTIGGMPVMLAKPQTFANRIGESVALMVEHHNLVPEKIVVLVDDMDTRLGKLCLLSKGGHGNHRGLINLIAHLKGNRNFPRLKLGIGSPPEKMDSRAYVLQKFCEQERKMMDSLIIQGVEVVRLVATIGVDKAIHAMVKSRQYIKP